MGTSSFDHRSQSKATPEKLDRTTRSVQRIINYNSSLYDGWILVNLYPQRATKTDQLHHHLDSSIHKKNLLVIDDILNKYEIEDIWAAWGNIN